MIAPHRRHLLHVAVLATLAACSSKAATTDANDQNLFTVKRADLPITVKENAELQALRETVVRSEVEGQATIIYIIAEGSTVPAGERLVELDVSDLVEKKATQEISVEKARAMLTQAEKEKEILKNETTTKENTASSNLRITEMELEKFLGRLASSRTRSEGKNADMIKKLAELVSMTPASAVADTAEATEKDGQAGVQPAVVAQVDPRNFKSLVDKATELLQVEGEQTAALDRDMGEMSNKVLQQVDKIRLAMADLKVKEETLVHSRRLASKQFITRNEFESDRLKWQSQVSNVTLAWNDLDLLVNYTLAKERIKLKQDVDNARLELARVRSSNSAAEVKAVSDLASKKSEFELASERLTNLKRQIDSAVIKAPTPGLVVYARLDRDRRGGEAVREGVQVRERQELIVLPDTSKMRCMIKVQEAQVEKVIKGQPAFVKIEANGETFTGKVTSVAPVADSNSGWMTSDRKVYTTMVDLDNENPDARLRSRMAAEVTIIVGTIKDTLPVPLQSVHRERSVFYVWKQTPNGPEAVVVTPGRQNAEVVEVTQGLSQGDVIFIAPPVGVQDPKFAQPVAPTPAANAEDTKNSGAGQAAPTTIPGGTAPGGDAPGNGRRGGARGDATDPAGGQGQGGNRGRGMGTQKKFAEMTPEELTQYKERLPMMQGMVDRTRDSGDEEKAKSLADTFAKLQQALEAGKLDEAQTQADKLRAAMRGGRPGGRNGGGPGGNGPGGNGPGGNAPGGEGAPTEGRGGRGN